MSGFQLGYCQGTISFDLPAPSRGRVFLLGLAWNEGTKEPKFKKGWLLHILSLKGTNIQFVLSECLGFYGWPKMKSKSALFTD